MGKVDSHPGDHQRSERLQHLSVELAQTLWQHYTKISFLPSLSWHQYYHLIASLVALIFSPRLARSHFKVLQILGDARADRFQRVSHGEMVQTLHQAARDLAQESPEQSQSLFDDFASLRPEVALRYGVQYGALSRRGPYHV